MGIIIIYVVSCPGRRFYGGKDSYGKTDIYGGSLPGFPIMFCCFWYLFMATGEMGYDLCHAIDYVFSCVLGGGSHWWDAVVKAYKKML